MLFNCDVGRRLLRIPWTARRSNQFILKQISPEYSLERLMLKLKLHYFSYLMQRADSFERPWCWERLKVGGEGDDRGWDFWMASVTQWTWIWVNSRSWIDRVAWCAAVHGVAKSRQDWATQLDWTVWRTVVGVFLWLLLGHRCYLNLDSSKSGSWNKALASLFGRESQEMWWGEWRVRQQLRGIQGQEMITLSELIYSLSVSPHTAP